MAQVTNKQLAKSLANRIGEVLRCAGLTLAGYAELSEVKQSYLKSIYAGTKPAAVETAFKLSTSIGEELHDFLNFSVSLPINLKDRPTIKAFYKKYEGKGLGYFWSEEEALQKPAEQTRKYERDTIAHIVLKTNYFDTAHLVGQMITDFARDHDLILESGRLYELLAKYVDKELEKSETTKKTKEGKVSKKKVFAYVKKK